MEAAGLEKIKTIGDSHMVAGGPPTPRSGHLVALLELAIAMGEATTRVRTPTGDPLQLRMGVDRGSVVAGVIGHRKCSYDVWGDTVNTASRMESRGVPGRIQVTARVARAASPPFDFEPRTSVEVKGKGKGKGAMKTFLLVGARPAHISTSSP